MNNDLHKMLRKSIHRNNKGKANMDYIDVNAINKEVFPDETPQMAKDQLKRKLYGESINEIGDTPKGQYMIGQAAHKVRNDDVRRQRISNYLRDKYGWTPREYFEGQNDASYGVNKYKTQEGVPPFIEPYIRKVAKETVDRFTEEEQSRINEIGDTPRGQYALGKVAGRARGRIDNRKKGEFSRKDIRNFKETEFDASQNPTDKFYDGYWDAYNNEYHKRYGNPYETFNESKNMNKALIRLTESDLHKIVKESVDKILKEDANVNTEARWSEYERLVDQIRNATQKLYMTTSNQDTNTPSYDETEGRLHRFAEGVLSVLEEFDFVDYGFDPTQHITW